MSDLRLNDFVRTGPREEDYEQVYSFMHRNENADADFLLLLPSRLELSSHHIVFVEGRGAIPALMLRIGDTLVGSEAPLSAILNTKKRGVYAPLTSSGVIIANGVQASNYVSFQDSEVLMIGRWKTMFTFHWLCQAYQRPHRTWCWLSGCKEEKYNGEGLSSWAVFPYNVLTALLSMNPFLQAMAFLPFVAVLMAISYPLVALLLMVQLTRLYKVCLPALAKNL